MTWGVDYNGMYTTLPETHAYQGLVSQVFALQGFNDSIHSASGM